MENNNTKKRFYTARMYRATEGRTYAVIEGNLTHDITLSQGKKDKYIMNSLASGENDFARIARYVGMKIPENIELKTFMNIRVFAERAMEFEKHCKKGTHVLVAGYIKYSDEYKNLTLNVDKFIVNPGFQNRFISGGIARCTNVYESHSGDEIQKPELLLVPGTIVWDGNLKTINEKPMYKFTMDSFNNPVELMNVTTKNDAADDEDEGGRISVTAFGRVAERMAKIVKTGTVISVNGNLSKHENEETGKIYYNMVADDFNLIGWPPRKDDQTEEDSSVPTCEKATSVSEDLREISNDDKNQSKEDSFIPECEESTFGEILDDDEDIPF